MPNDLQDWNELIIAEFRAHAGIVRWSTEQDLAAGRPIPRRLPGFNSAAGAPILLVSHIGARTGRLRTNPLMYRPVDRAFAVFATYGGSPRPPAWHRNIQQHPEVTVEVGTDRVAAVARVTRGPERERIWRRQVEVLPAFADFQAAAGREIPVVVLDPTAPPADGGRGQ